MELLTAGDLGVTTANTGFSSPYQETESFFVSNPMSVVYSSPPPQKLRPIRPNGRSPTSSQGNYLPLTGGGSCCLDRGLENLGLLVDQVCGINGESNELFEPPVKAEDSGTQCTGSGGPGRAGMNLDPNFVGGLLEIESSSSSEDDTVTGVDECGIQKRKRKRKTRKKLENFLESLVMKVLDRQEQMHNELIETMMRRDRERVIREETWKQQEIERMKRNDELRAQENARNLALISFIQDVMGHKVEFPQPLPIIHHPDKYEEKDVSNVLLLKDSNSDSSNRRWPTAEVQALIMLRAGMEQKFRTMGAKASNFWDEISAGMCSMGYNRTGKKCKEKWENINKYFRKSMGSGEKKRKENGKTCPYFHELDVLYKNGLVNPGNVSDIRKIENVTDSI